MVVIMRVVEAEIFIFVHAIIEHMFVNERKLCAVCGSRLNEQVQSKSSQVCGRATKGIR